MFIAQQRDLLKQVHSVEKAARANLDEVQNERKASVILTITLEKICSSQG